MTASSERFLSFVSPAGVYANGSGHWGRYIRSPSRYCKLVSACGPPPVCVCACVCVCVCVQCAFVFGEIELVISLS